jgi:hypothetical protein
MLTEREVSLNQYDPYNGGCFCNTIEVSNSSHSSITNLEKLLQFGLGSETRTYEVGISSN